MMTSVFPSYYITRTCAQEPEPHDFCSVSILVPRVLPGDPPLTEEPENSGLEIDISAKVSFYSDKKGQKAIVVPYLDAIMIVHFPKSMRLKTVQVSSRESHTYDFDATRI